jgi:hypothetical protein
MSGNVEVPGVEQQRAAAFAATARKIVRQSKADRGNIDVKILANGKLAERVGDLSEVKLAPESDNLTSFYKV